MPSKLKHTKVNGGVSALLERVKTPGTVDVGIIDAGEHPSGDITVAGIGFAHEFGTATLPERSFIRFVIQKEKKAIIALQKKLVKRIQKGEITTKQGLGLIGEFVADKIRQRIVSLKSPPNTPETIEKKGSSNPLIDTGQLKNSITYEVNE